MVVFLKTSCQVLCFMLLLFTSQCFGQHLQYSDANYVSDASSESNIYGIRSSRSGSRAARIRERAMNHNKSLQVRDYKHRKHPEYVSGRHSQVAPLSSKKRKYIKAPWERFPDSEEFSFSGVPNSHSLEDNSVDKVGSEIKEFRRRRLEWQNWKKQQVPNKPRPLHPVHKPDSLNHILKVEEVQYPLKGENSADSSVPQPHFSSFQHESYGQSYGQSHSSQKLKTVWGEHLLNHSKFIPHPKYPRPDLVRNSNNHQYSKSSTLSSVWWQTLNGFWDYAISRMDEAYDAITVKKLSWDGKIRVPYPLESQLSNVGSDIKLEPKQFLWYRRSFRLSSTMIGSYDNEGARPSWADTPTTNSRHLRYYINFEAVDYACMVWVNDIEVGGHRGGNTPFRLDISDAVAAEEIPGARNDLMAHELLVRVEDSTTGAQMRGKQSLHPHGIWYSRMSGIWQSVWLEAVPAVHIAKLKITSLLGSPIIDQNTQANANDIKRKTKKANNAFSVNQLKDEGKDEEEEVSDSNHGVFKVKVVLDAAPPSTLDPNLGGGEFGDDDGDEKEEEIVRSKKRNLRSRDVKNHINRRNLATAGSSSNFGTSNIPPINSDLPWSRSAKLHAEVDVYAAGQVGGNAGNRVKPAPVILDILEPMGIVTKVEGDHLLIVGIKPGGQAQVAGIREGYFLTNVNNVEVRNFNEVQEVLGELKQAYMSTEKTKDVSSSSGGKVAPDITTGLGSRYYLLEVSPTVKVGFGTCSFYGHGETPLANPTESDIEASKLANQNAAQSVMGGSGHTARNHKITGSTKPALSKAENDYMKAANQGIATWDFTTIQPDAMSGLSNSGASRVGDNGDELSVGGAWQGAFNANQQQNQNMDRNGVRRKDECVAEVSIASPNLWSPSSPFLYDFVVRIVHEKTPSPSSSSASTQDENYVMIDEVGSYGAIRTVDRKRTSDGHIRFFLNGKPLFMLGILDQGWWPDGLLTPPSDAAQLHDIEFLKASGFNTIRKHAKVENRRYYYHCDRLGMLVWQDQVSADEDGRGATELSPKHWTRLSKDRPEEGVWSDADHAQFMGEFEAMVDMLENHPSIVIWVPFNEAWGQHRTVEVASWISKRDPTRLINAASGGNFWPVGDIADNHNYPNPNFPFFIPDRPDLDQPLQDYSEFIKIVGEFGGHGLAVPGHLWGGESASPHGMLGGGAIAGVTAGTGGTAGAGAGGTWGYGKLPQTTAEYKERYRVSIAALRELQDDGIAGGIYTQTTDVEGEVNGLLTYDRKVAKIDPSELKEWHIALFNLEPRSTNNHKQRKMRI